MGSGVVLADFNKHFLDGTYQSQQDVNISVEAVTSAALVTARALHKIASGSKGPTEIEVCSMMAMRRPNANHEAVSFSQFLFKVARESAFFQAIPIRKASGAAPKNKHAQPSPTGLQTICATRKQELAASRHCAGSEEGCQSNCGSTEGLPARLWDVMPPG